MNLYESFPSMLLQALASVPETWGRAFAANPGQWMAIGLMFVGIALLSLWNPKRRVRRRR
jgi:hypothetical protein